MAQDRLRGGCISFHTVAASVPGALPTSHYSKIFGRRDASNGKRLAPKTEVAIRLLPKVK